jgi:pyruvate dehydrogenase E1 component alpha subunit
MEADPIEHCLRIIKENKWMSDKEIEATDVWAKKEVEEAVTFAENSPYPDPSELYEDIYQEPNYPYIKEY